MDALKVVEATLSRSAALSLLLAFHHTKKELYSVDKLGHSFPSNCMLSEALYRTKTKYYESLEQRKEKMKQAILQNNDSNII